MPKNTKQIIMGIVIALASLLLLVQTGSAEPSQPIKDSLEIQRSLEELVAKEKIPGMIAAISSSRGIEAIASAGIRKVGSKKRMKEEDLVHLGSCGKAMTSVLVADSVERNLLTWETTILDVFPELKARLHNDYHDVTIWELLTHRSGMPANAKNWWVHQNRPLRKRRMAILTENLKDESASGRGNYLYSNLGYLVAACMLEKLTDSTWETLIQKRVFEPLQMTSAGFGPPGKRGKIDQPWGHVKTQGEWKAKQFDNAEALGPAGRINCTVEDWAKFISLQLPREEGTKALLGDESLKKLTTPVGKYAGGWIVTRRTWGNGDVLTHNGSNTTWYATVWVAPLLDRAYMVVANSRDERSKFFCHKMIARLIEIDNNNK